ncbi:MAG TPA: hypothetical protein VNU66_03505 [Mycobacteriales bacterium]|nr:hypothetical protein [Mycobacteriales bacterium]
MTTLVLPHAATSTAPVARALACELRTDGVPAGTAAEAVAAVLGLLGQALATGAPLPGGALRVSWSVGGDGGVHLSVRDATGLRTAQVGALVPH